MPNDVEYVLDASILLNFLANEPKVVEKMLSIDDDRAYLTPIAIAETYYALLLKKIVEPDKLTMLLEKYGAIPINSGSALHFAEIKRDAGITSRNMDRDIWMVAFAKHIGATLLTTDEKLKHRLRHIDPPIEVIKIAQ